MKIKRTYKKPSLKFGKVETVDEAKAREVFGQTMIALHPHGACGSENCEYCAAFPMKRLLKGEVVETFFSEFVLLES